jgi:hypothetical protein
MNASVKVDRGCAIIRSASREHRPGSDKSAFRVANSTNGIVSGVKSSSAIKRARQEFPCATSKVASLFITVGSTSWT